MMQDNQRNNDDENGAVASRPMEPGQTGESGGGPYPKQRDDSYPDAHDFKGGPVRPSLAQLGEETLDGNEDRNSPSAEH
jgi:hypothetical protein